MATEWKHLFSPSFSGIVAVLFIALMAIAFIGGRHSVKVRPRRRGRAKKQNYGDEPRFNSAKCRRIRGNFYEEFRCTETLADSVICFCSVVMDILWSLLAGGIFVEAIVREHWLGLVQFFINNLHYNDSAAWGDILAGLCVAVLGVIIAAIFYFLRLAGQQLKAEELVKGYLAMGIRPLLTETPDLVYFAKRFIWAVSKVIAEERASKRMAKSALRLKAEELISADREGRLIKRMM